MKIMSRLSKVFVLLTAVLMMLGDTSVYAARSSGGSRSSGRSSGGSAGRSSGRMSGASRSSSRSSGRTSKPRAAARSSRSSRGSAGAKARSSSRSRSQAKSRSTTRSKGRGTSAGRRPGSRAAKKSGGRKSAGSRAGRKSAGSRAGKRSGGRKSAGRKAGGRKAAGKRSGGRKAGKKAGRKSGGRKAGRKSGRKSAGKKAGRKAGRKSTSRSTQKSAARATSVKNSLANSAKSPGVGTASSVARGAALASNARVGLATTTRGTAIGVSLGIGTGYLRGGGYFGRGCGTGWVFSGGYWGGLGCSWYPGIGFFGLSSWGCYYNPFLSACLFPWTAGLIATGIWPAWVFPGFGCTLYAAASYPGCILTVEQEAVSSTWCGVYYRDPETGMLIRYIRPRVIDVETVKLNVPVRSDGYERIVVIARNSDALGNELPEEPEDADGLKYIALNDPKNAEPADAPEEAKFEDLTPEELDIIARTNKKIDETSGGRHKLKKLDELKGIDLEKADLKKQEK